MASKILKRQQLQMYYREKEMPLKSAFWYFVVSKNHMVA